MVELHQGYPLARLTTVRTGGAAELFAAPGTIDELRELLVWASAHGHQVSVVGSGSNLLVADQGVPGLVLHLEAELARIEAVAGGLRCGGGARMPKAAARTAAAFGNRRRLRADERQRLRRRARDRPALG
jgi:UDP-N-acetylenolpyruvoylglucosamine reductase